MGSREAKLFFINRSITNTNIKVGNKSQHERGHVGASDVHERFVLHGIKPQVISKSFAN
ncbi:hypothetical protein J6590_091984 [Homalodisca vitripennis]|nr:hypothetical protein J6590_091984 [Homalodisca vitripennis]